MSMKLLTVRLVCKRKSYLEKLHVAYPTRVPIAELLEKEGSQQ